MGQRPSHPSSALEKRRRHTPNANKYTDAQGHSCPREPLGGKAQDVHARLREMRHEKLAHWVGGDSRGDAELRQVSRQTRGPYPDHQPAMHKIRWRVVRAFLTDGQPCIVLAAARLRYVTGTKGLSIRYLDMTLLAKCSLEEQVRDTTPLETDRTTHQKRKCERIRTLPSQARLERQPLRHAWSRTKI